MIKLAWIKLIHLIRLLRPQINLTMILAVTVAPSLNGFNHNSSYMLELLRYGIWNSKEKTVSYYFVFVSQLNSNNTCEVVCQIQSLMSFSIMFGDGNLLTIFEGLK